MPQLKLGQVRNVYVSGSLRASVRFRQDLAHTMYWANCDVRITEEGRYSASCLPTGYPPRVNFRNHIACQESLLQVSRIRACSGHVVASCRCTITCDRYNVTVKMPLHIGSVTGVTGRYNAGGFG